MIRKQFLEDLGIDVPDEAARFYTENNVIFFIVPFVEEYGSNIVFKEDIEEETLTDKQIEALKAANCYGATGWTIL